MRPNAEPQTQTQTQTTSSQTMTTKDGREAWETDMEGSSLPESESHFLFFLCSLFLVWRFQKRVVAFFFFYFLVFPWVIYKTCSWLRSLTDFVMVLVSPLPVIKNAAESERVAADSRMDRMTIWMRNVESRFYPAASLCRILSQNVYRGRRGRQAKLRRRLIHNERSPTPRSTSPTLAHRLAEPHVPAPTSGARCQPDLPGG